MDKQVHHPQFEATAELLRRYVRDGRVAGVATYIARKGQVLHRQYEGYADLDKGLPLGDGTIYRMYSMTKLITAVAALQLYERGLFRMQDPVDDILPGFKDHKVFVKTSGGTWDIVPAKRPVTFLDLFTMRSGLSYPSTPDPAGQALQEALKAYPSGTLTTQQYMNLAGSLPLAFHPGESFLYGLSIDALGAAVEVISGKRLGAYMQEHIFAPLGMTDSGFVLTEAQAARLSEIHCPKDGALVSGIAGGLFDVRDPLTQPQYEAGGGGLYCSLDDYARFAHMLLREGTLDGVRMLGRKTVALMRTNHVTPEQSEHRRTSGYGYGLGVRVMLEPEKAGINGSLGEWGWEGMGGTWVSIDPQEDMVILFLAQQYPGNQHLLVPPFLQTVYGAL